MRQREGAPCNLLLEEIRHNDADGGPSILPGKPHFPHVLRVRNRRLKQHKVSARLARVQPDDRMPLCGKCETFRLAIQIAERPRIAERRGAAPRREIIEPREPGGLVTEQIEAAIRTYRGH